MGRLVAMLVLSRKQDESIFIGDNIKIKVLSFKGHGEYLRVNIGIDAPRDVNIVRDELAEYCPECKTVMFKGVYDMKTVYICPKCNTRKVSDENGELRGQAD